MDLKDYKLEPHSVALIHEEVISSLFRAFINGKLKPGERLREEAVAQALNVSRSPVRRAFQEMARQGVLELIPRRGARVALWTIADVDDFRHVRQLLEGLATQMATSRIEVHELEEIFRLAEKSNANHSTLSIEEIIDLDMRFHNNIIQASRNNSLISAHETMMLRTKMFMIAEKHIYPPPLGQTTLPNEHLRIVSAMQEGDELHARELMERHIRNVSEGLIDRMQVMSSNIEESVPNLINRLAR